MTATQVIAELKVLPLSERARVLEATIRDMAPEERRSLERFLRRVQYPDVPEAFWQGVEDHEDGRVVEMETALREVPPPRK